MYHAYKHVCVIICILFKPLTILHRCSLSIQCPLLADHVLAQTMQVVTYKTPSSVWPVSPPLHRRRRSFIRPSGYRAYRKPTCRPPTGSAMNMVTPTMRRYASSLSAGPTWTTSGYRPIYYPRWHRQPTMKARRRRMKRHRVHKFETPL